MAISNELERIIDAKSALRTSIINKGVVVSENATIDAYSAFVDAIPSGGGGGEDMKDFIERTITTFEIPDGVTTVGGGAFAYCTSLTSISFPQTLTSIETQGFMGCTALTSINIPNTVTSIGMEAFSGCSGLTSINIPNTLTSIDYSAFQSCSGLTSINIPNSVTSIGVSAFHSCSGLTEVTIPDNIVIISNNAFRYCSALSRVNIGTGITSIGGYAFDGLYPGSSTIYMYGTTPPTIGTNAFRAVYRIYVPSDSLETYKTATNWSSYASIIYPF